MRIAMVSPLFESVPPRFYGGTERVVSNLCRGLSGRGFEIALFASGDSQIEDVELVPVVDEALRLTKAQITDPLAYHFKMLAMVAERAEEFDLIHNHHDYWMLPLTSMTQVPLVTTLHGRLDLPEASVFSHYLKSGYVSISDSQRAAIPTLSWLKTIHHGIEVSEVPFFPHPGSYLAYLGRISTEKRPDWAIQIAQKSGIPLKIAAKIEGPHSQAYYDHFIKPHVDGRFIEFVGEISDQQKSDFLGNAMALVFPIDWPEPFGLVIIESLACGTPVLARPCGSVPELLEEGITGYIDRDIANLAARVADLPKISRLECRRWVERRFSLDRMTEDYIHVYRRLAPSKFQSHHYRRNLIHPI